MWSLLPLWWLWKIPRHQKTHQTTTPLVSALVLFGVHSRNGDKKRCWFWTHAHKSASFSLVETNWPFNPFHNAWRWPSHTRKKSRINHMQKNHFYIEEIEPHWFLNALFVFPLQTNWRSYSLHTVMNNSFQEPSPEPFEGKFLCNKKQSSWKGPFIALSLWVLFWANTVHIQKSKLQTPFVLSKNPVDSDLFFLSSVSPLAILVFFWKGILARFQCSSKNHEIFSVAFHIVLGCYTEIQTAWGKPRRIWLTWGVSQGDCIKHQTRHCSVVKADGWTVDQRGNVSTRPSQSGFTLGFPSTE